MINTWLHAKILFSIGVPALVLASSTSATAQTEMELGSRLPQAAPAEIPMKRLSPPDRARASILAYSRCVVGRFRPQVERALALPFGDAAWSKAMQELATPDCLRYGQIQMTTALLRGGLFNALYRKDFWRAAPTSLSTKPIDYTRDVSNPLADDSRTYLGLHDFADCVVLADPANTRMVALANVGTEAETASYSRLLPVFSACMTVGQNIRFSKIVLSGALSEALYRRSKMK